MKRRDLLLLGGAAAATTGAVILLTPDRTEPPPNSASPLAFPGLAPRLANAARIEVVRHYGTLVIRRAATGAWVLPDRADHPARPERVREVLVGLTELRLIEPRTANPEMLERLGVEDPTRPGATSALLRVLDANGAPIAELIVEYAGVWKADVIVLGTHGRRGFSHLLMGSDAESVVRLSPIPVLLVRSPEGGVPKAAPAKRAGGAKRSTGRKRA